MVGIALWLGAAAASALQGSWTGFTPPPPGGSASQWPANALEDVYLVFDGNGESLQVVCSNSLEPTNACVTPTIPPRDGLNSGWSSALGVSDEARVSLRFDDANSTLLAGMLLEHGSRIEWADGSYWSKLQPITRVHMVAMSHMDVGYALPDTIAGLSSSQAPYAVNVLNRWFSSFLS